MNENLLEEFAADAQSGKLLTERRRRYRKSFGSRLHTYIQMLHNRIVARGDGSIFSRGLIHRQVARRLRCFAQLTPETRTALEWFEIYGSSPNKKSGRPVKPLTTATREDATYAALSLLKQLKKIGLEDIEVSDLPDLSPDASDYRSQCRMRHAAATVFRCCVAKGLLTANPLEGTSNETFGSRARRDFVAPDELAKLLNLESVDRSNPRQLMDRLLMLMYLDSGLRKNELAAVRREDVRELSPGKFQVTLDGASQKMGDKPTAVIDILYGQTAELLGLYLRQRGITPGALFRNTKGDPATGDTLYDYLKREAQRIGIKTYFGAVPSCHTLRRTLATVNADRLGMCMNPHEIAQRLRCSIEVAYKHYVQDNLLLRSMKADEQRKQLAGDPLSNAQKHLEALQQLGISGESLASVRAEVERKLAPVPILTDATWTGEAEALRQLGERWELNINDRFMRRHFQNTGAMDYKGERGRVRYRDDVLADLLARDPIKTYLPPKANWRQITAVTAQFDTLHVGQMALVRREDGPRILRLLRSRFADDEAMPQSRVA